MNSSQRRKAKREFPYVIKLNVPAGSMYHTFDSKIKTASKWCKRNSKGGYKVHEYWHSAEFKFFSQGDAAFFALKWL